ncbi:citrate lyase subunit alpha [Aminobacterium mobile]
MIMQRNSINRLVPAEVPGLGNFLPFAGEQGHNKPLSFVQTRKQPDIVQPETNKLAPNLRIAIERSGLQEGMTVSFHHHLRNGDKVMEIVLKEIAEMGIKNLTLAPSSLTSAHDFVADLIKSGVVTKIYTSGIRDKIGETVSHGELGIPIIVRSHGGRARAIEEGSLPIDVAFLAASSCDIEGNMTGVAGPSAFGSMGYAIGDARYARHVIAITDNLVDFPLKPHISVPQNLVNQIVKIDSIGDPQKLATGAVRITKSPVQLQIARLAYELIQASGLITPGFSFQAGGGGMSIAVTQFVKEYMIEKQIKGSFALGGISKYMSDLLEMSLFEALFDVQSFDPAMGDSILRNPTHYEIDPSWYANPMNKGCMTRNLDVAVLGALDLDVDFNVNVLTGHDGVLRGASGGHCDAAAGAKLTIIVAPSFRRGVPTIKGRTETVVTPGESVDAFVCERGICINPAREDLIEAAIKSNLPLKDIRNLKMEVEKLTGVPETVRFDTNKIVALVEYRDGSLIDVVYKVKE